MRAVALLALLLPGMASAHGGGVPYVTAAPVGDYRLYVWVNPENVTAGEAIHLTVGVTLAGSDGAETPVTDADVRITLRSDGNDSPITLSAQSGETVGQVYFEADATVPSAGEWIAAVAVSGPRDSGEVEFALNVSPAAGPNWLVLGGGLLLVGAGAGAFALRWLRRQPGQGHNEHARAAR